MKHFIIALIVSIILISSGLIVYSLSSSKQFTIEKPTVLQNEQVYPICYLIEQDIQFNPMFPYGNEMDAFSIDQTTAVFSSNSPINLYFDKGNFKVVDYEILDPLINEIVASGQIENTNIVPYEVGLKVRLELPSLIVAKHYVLKMTVEGDTQPLYYYQSFYVGDYDQASVVKTITQAHQALFEGSNKYEKFIQGNKSGGTFYSADQNSSENTLLWKTNTNLVKMNEPVPMLIDYDELTGQFEVQMKFTVANRIDYDFEYWDFTEVYKGRASEGNIEISAYARSGNRKNEPYFDEEMLQWVVDEGALKEETQTLYSDNGQYVAVTYQNQIYLLDKTTNGLVKIFGLDQLDSDYLMDEDEHHGIRLLKLADNGDMSYMVYGYIAAGRVAGNNGILVSRYLHGNQKNENLLFVNSPIAYKTLKYYMQNRSYYNEKYDHFYWMISNAIYDIDLKEKTLTRVGELSGYTYFSSEGFIYSLDSLSKENNAIQIFDLTAKEMKTNLLTYENEQIQMIGARNGKIAIGTYDLENTYEFLDGHVFYPYNAIKILNFQGEVEGEKSAGLDLYYQDVEFSNEGFISASVYQMNQYISSIPIMSQVRYVKINQQNLYQWSEDEVKVYPKVVITDEVEGMRRMIVDYKSVSLSENLIPMAKEAANKKIVVLELSTSPPYTSYEIYSEGELIEVTNRFDQALNKSKNHPQVVIYEKNQSGQRKLLFDESVTAYVRLAVPAISQFPELVRGCEVTALSMFLSYYTGSNIDKMALADQLRRDVTPQTTDLGMISFGDMHKGFVGSLTVNSEPGLGVYIEPLYDLSKNYVEGLYNISGSSFDQVLNFVGNGRPVLVITPSNYNLVHSSQIQQWITTSGYMEVTYKEHSVLIVGYDAEWVYFNDPDSGRLNKQNIEAFKAGWENQGSQALVVIE